MPPIHEAKLSFSQRASHHAMVTRFPNHWCAISWDTMLATICFVPAEVFSGSTRIAISR